MTHVIKTLICLANSRKLGGHCVAGKEWRAEGPGAWIRPVSVRPHEELSPAERCFSDGAEPGLLDLMDIAFMGPLARGFQSENWLLDPGVRWVRRGGLVTTALTSLVDRPSRLWADGYSTNAGANDRVPLKIAERFSGSLALIHVTELIVRSLTQLTPTAGTKRRVQARFRYNGAPYALWITDPLVESKGLQRADGDYLVPAAHLTISLGEPFEGYVYKLVAAVLPG